MIGLLGCENDTTFYKAISHIELPQKVVYVDSIVQFKNYSDSVNVTYKWNFGDGTISDKRIVDHIYRNYGNYTVSLTTYVNNIPTDTSTVNVKVIIGEKYFDMLKKTDGIDFVECSDSSILLLGVTRYVDDENPKMFLSKFDKNLRNKWTKYLDANLNPAIRNIEGLSDGNFILSGSFDNTNNNGNFALAKIDSSGNVLWDYKYSQTNGYCRYAIESKDGGIVAIGNEDYLHTSSGNTVQIVSVMKTDANGKFVWKRQFVDDWLMEAANIISVDDGYIFASSTRGVNNALNDLDSLVITKIGFDSHTIWKKSKRWQISYNYIYNVFSSYIGITNSKLIAVNDGNGFVMVFDLQGNFIKRNQSGDGKNRFVATTKNNSFIIGGGATSWDGIGLNGFDNSGEAKWSKSYGTRDTRCWPSYGFGSKVKLLQDGNLLFLGTSYQPCTDDFNRSSMLLFKINGNGEIQ